MFARMRYCFVKTGVLLQLLAQNGKGFRRIDRDDADQLSLMPVSADKRP